MKQSIDYKSRCHSKTPAYLLYSVLSLNTIHLETDFYPCLKIQVIHLCELPKDSLKLMH